MNEHYDKTVDILRLYAVDATDTEVYQNYLTSVKVHIQPLDESFIESLEGASGKEYLMFSDTIDIEQEDKISYSGDIYLITGVEQYDFEGKTHTETRIRLTEVGDQITVIDVGEVVVVSQSSTIDDSNLDFIFSSEPTVLVINGGVYQKTGGAITWSWSSATSTATLNHPVGTGGTIFGLR